MSFRYPSGTLANDCINLKIERGECVAIVGQNGAGKTTLVKLMNGLNKPTEGDVFVDGNNTRERTTAKISSLVSYVFQNPDDQIFKSNVRDEIAFWCRYKKLSKDETEKRVSRAIEITHLEKYADANPHELSYMLKKFVSIASILVVDAPYVILDEPTAGQDIIGTALLEKIIHHLVSEGKTVITITHDMEFVKNNFPRVIAMAHGRILADGTSEQIFANDEIVSKSGIAKPQILRLSERIGCGTVLFADQLVKKLR